MADTFTGYTGGKTASPAERAYNVPKLADPVSDRPDPTELARLYDRLAASASRFRDMLGVMEGRLDFVAGPVPESAQGAAPTTAPPAQPGTIEALREVSGNFHDLCNRLDGELCRMMKIL